jgi:hypothetical protein
MSARGRLLMSSQPLQGDLLSQVILIEKMPDQDLYRPFAITTAAAAGFTAATAIRNYTLQGANKPAYLLRQGTD